MSALTPEEIADYPLRTAVRGYKVEQVDELLDRVADRIEALEQEAGELREQLVAAERRADESSATEATLKRTLVTAQRAAEDTVAEARTEAASIRADAQAQADELLGTARAEAEDLRTRAAEALRDAEVQADELRAQAGRDVAHLREAAERFRTGMREHLDAQAALLEQAPDPAPLDDLAAAGGQDDTPRDSDASPGEGAELFSSNGPGAGLGDAGGDFSG